MRSRNSESFIVLPLLPIFIIGMFPMLLIGMMGYAGLAIFGILLVRVALAATMDAHSDFNLEIIAHGYGRAPERAAHASDLKAETRFAVLFHMAGIAMIVAGISGIFLGY